MVKFDSVVLSRAKKLSPQYLGKNVKVYNGKTYYEFVVSENMIGLKAGFFSPTRSPYIYKKGGKKN